MNESCHTNEEIISLFGVDNLALRTQEKTRSVLAERRPSQPGEDAEDPLRRCRGCLIFTGDFQQEPYH